MEHQKLEKGAAKAAAYLARTSITNTSAASSNGASTSNTATPNNIGAPAAEARGSNLPANHMM